MADVVRLQERLSRMPRRERLWHEVPAAVLLFTGVRYEKLTPAMVAKTRAGRRNAETGKDARQ
ncbi:hypothetical protein [Mycoplana rhizolycopersici]|jgi:hypothetical protein|uniref:Uncharacterized protein n=1 Tax=Mycoplana rhizolycopersici TaxID=2746702 RepID=A0ABX2Q8X8_9HYPH|nr:hypothetical protein [Rhizobium rhizolycopersici]NVP54158.1 hypothetical protein [Rhizobium rhizolycopersici]